MAAVALVPLVLFPALGLMPLKEVCLSYADPNIFLFMGGFFLAIAIEKCGLHRRVALGIIRLSGTNGNRIILGFIIATGFLSLWLSNTATTLMMYPIALSVIRVVESENPEAPGLRAFSLSLMLSIAYASNFAVGTIIGTPPNVAFVGYVAETYGYTIGFLDWMLLFLPLTILLMAALYLMLVKVLYPNHIAHSEKGRAFIQQELQALGRLSVTEKRVAAVFLGTVLLWTTRDLLNGIQQVMVLDDAMIAIAGAIALFIVPAEKKVAGHNKTLLEWEDTSKMAWGILLLFGGGIALAKVMEGAGLMQRLGQFLSSYADVPLPVMVLVVATLSIFLSEVMSNVAQVIVMAPVVSALAESMQVDPLTLGLPMTLAASCASMLPMGTPPNAIVFASGHIRIREMVRTGWWLNLIAIALITLFSYLLQPMIFQLK